MADEVPEEWQQGLADFAKRMRFTDSATLLAQPEVRRKVEAQYQQMRKDAEQQEETRRKHEEWQAQRRAELDAERRAKYNAAWQRWEAVEKRAIDKPLHEIACLHAPVTEYTSWWRGECTGCELEVSGYEYDMDEWPCQTFLIVEKWYEGKA